MVEPKSEIRGFLTSRRARITPADHGLTIFTFTAEPGSRHEEALRLLGSWAATIDQAEAWNTTS